MERNILNPLQLRNQIVQGYNYANGGYKPSDLEVFSTAPSAALTSTGIDMAKFMICHLQSGMYDGARIVKEETADEMQRRNFGNCEELNASKDAMESGNVSVLLMDSSLVSGRKTGSLNHANHWAVPLSVGAAGESNRLKIWSWGAEHDLNQNKDEFEDFMWRTVIGYFWTSLQAQKKPGDDLLSPGRF